MWERERERDLYICILLPWMNEPLPNYTWMRERESTRARERARECERDEGGAGGRLRVGESVCVVGNQHSMFCTCPLRTGEVMVMRPMMCWHTLAPTSFFGMRVLLLLCENLMRFRSRYRRQCGDIRLSRYTGESRYVSDTHGSLEIYGCLSLHEPLWRDFVDGWMTGEADWAFEVTLLMDGWQEKQIECWGENHLKWRQRGLSRLILSLHTYMHMYVSYVCIHTYVCKRLIKANSVPTYVCMYVYVCIHTYVCM